VTRASKRASRGPSPLEVIRNESMRISGLRMQMVEHHTFWGHLLLGVKMVPETSLPSIAATDCLTTIWYNPLLTQHLDFRQLGFVIAHELGHHVEESMPRMRGRDRHRWNCATDYAINRMVAGIETWTLEGPGPLYRVPDGDIPGLGEMKILLDERFDGMIAEVIYEHLANEELPDPNVITITLGGTVIPGVSDHGGGIDVHIPVDLTEDERQILRDRIHDAAQAWDQKGRRGDVPGNIARDFDLRAPARVAWARLLQDLVGQALEPDEYSYRRPNRRLLAEGFIVPGVETREGPDVVVAVDTSGSMSADDLRTIGSELRTISRYAADITVLIADAKIRQVVQARDLPEFLATSRMKGGGGTSHIPIFDWLEENRRRPDLFIGITDLYSRFPEAPPPYPVLWITQGRHGRAPWGRVLEVNPS
jgi:predicted metal-dependent peptidase